MMENFLISGITIKSFFIKIFQRSLCLSNHYIKTANFHQGIMVKILSIGDLVAENQVIYWWNICFRVTFGNSVKMKKRISFQTSSFTANIN